MDRNVLPEICRNEVIKKCSFNALLLHKAIVHDQNRANVIHRALRKSHRSWFTKTKPQRLTVNSHTHAGNFPSFYNHAFKREIVALGNGVLASAKGGMRDKRTGQMLGQVPVHASRRQSLFHHHSVLER